MDAGYALTLSCRNRPGIVAKVSTALFEADGDIFSAQQFDDTESRSFFMRVLFQTPDAAAAERFRTAFGAIADDLGITWRLRDRSRRQRVLIMASRFDHCLADLLYRWRIGELPMKVCAIVANHPRETYDGLPFGDIPFHHLPVTPETKSQQEAAL
ncbi:MAG: ACT domain-containing protein, partial [Caulobacterales bacterium]|nr:ACT domain-containing protein [Caulobacterales bacterium]